MSHLTMRACHRPRRRTGWMNYISTDTHLGVATTLGSAVTAMCVQLVGASGNLAIHMTTRILLRSSSTHEPSDPPLEVVSFLLASAPRRSKPTQPREQARARHLRKRLRIKGLKQVSLARVTSGLAARQPASNARPPREERCQAAAEQRHSSATRRSPTADKREVGSLN